MSKVEVEEGCENSLFVIDREGDVYIRAEVSGEVYYILLDADGGVYCEEEVERFKIRPIPIGSVIKITV